MPADRVRAKSPDAPRGPGATMLRWALEVVPFIGVVVLVMAVVARLAAHGTSGFGLELLEDSITFLIGVQGIVIGSGHTFTPEPIARSIGWPAVRHGSGRSG